MIEYKVPFEEMTVLTDRKSYDFKDITEGPVFVDEQFATEIYSSDLICQRVDYVFYVQYGLLMYLTEDGHLTFGSAQDDFDDKTINILLKTETFHTYYLAQKWSDGSYTLYIIYVEPFGKFEIINNKMNRYMHGGFNTRK